jgi:hypothetical protein
MQMRKQLIEHPLRCEVTLFYSYILIMRRLIRLFENNHLPFTSYFTEARHKECSLLLYEYINSLLLIVIRIYHACSIRERPEKETVEQLATCKLLLEELRQSYEHALSERRATHQSNKWLFTPPLESIASDHFKKSRTLLLEEEYTLLRSYIEEDLCGINALNDRIALFDIMKNETSVLIIQERIQMIPVSQQRQRVHEMVGPMIRNITIAYENITKSILRSQSPKSNNYLMLYTQYKSYYWFIYGEFTVASIDWLAYSDKSNSDFMENASQAYTRLSQLIKFIDSKTKWFSTLLLEESVLRHHKTLEEKARTLLNQIKLEIGTIFQQYNNICHLEEIQSFQFQPGELDLRTIFQTKWTSLGKQSPLILETIVFLEKMAQEERSAPPVKAARGSPADTVT